MKPSFEPADKSIRSRRSDASKPLLFPVAESPSIQTYRIVESGSRIARFEENTWPLAALDADVTRRRYRLNFEAWPPQFRNYGKHVAYVLINYGNPPELFEQEQGRYVRWPSPGSIKSILQNLHLAINWLIGPWSENHPDTPIRSLGDLDGEHMNDLRRWIDRLDCVPKTRFDKLEVLVRAWHLNQWLPVEAHMPEPPWREEPWRIRRPERENKTYRVAQTTMAPLLEWALAFVMDFSDDILDAHTHYSERLSSLPPNNGSSDACRSTLDQLLSAGGLLPGSPLVGSGVRAGSIGWKALEYRHSVPALRLAHNFHRNYSVSDFVVSHDPEHSKLDYSISGRFHGRPWIPFVDVYDIIGGVGSNGEVGPLGGHLRTACLVVAAYLTGARPEEVLGLRFGAAPSPIIRPDGSLLHLVHGHVWKGSTRSLSGAPAEAQDAVWATIAPGARAVQVAEALGQIHGRSEGLIFTSNGRSLHTGTVTRWIDAFSKFVNERLVPRSSNPVAFTIPPDPHGPITLRRFRRTLAWFIRNRPDGEVALAIQYDHMSEVMGGGYAGTKESGMNELLLEEDWEHRKRTIAHLSEILGSGQGVSGPAAIRAVNTANALPRQLTAGDERRLRRDSSTTIYENPHAVALCVYYAPTGLCGKKGSERITSGPALSNCVDGCPNCARTDSHLDQLRSEATTLRAQAQISPKPLAQSMVAEAVWREGLASRFAETRIISVNGTPIASPLTSRIDEHED